MGDWIHEGAYRLTWSDEFDGAPGTPADRGTWQAEIGGSGWGNQELQYYTDEPGNAALDGAGNLALVVRRVNPELAGRRYGTGPSTGRDTPGAAASARRARSAHRSAATFTCTRSPGIPARSSGMSTTSCITP